MSPDIKSNKDFYHELFVFQANLSVFHKMFSYIDTENLDYVCRKFSIWIKQYFCCIRKKKSFCYLSETVGLFDPEVWSRFDQDRPRSCKSKFLTFTAECLKWEMQIITWWSHFNVVTNLKEILYTILKVQPFQILQFEITLKLL